MLVRQQPMRQLQVQSYLSSTYRLRLTTPLQRATALLCPESDGTAECAYQPTCTSQRSCLAAVQP